MFKKLEGDIKDFHTGNLYLSNNGILSIGEDIIHELKDIGSFAEFSVHADFPLVSISFNSDEGVRVKKKVGRYLIDIANVIRHYRIPFPRHDFQLDYAVKDGQIFLSFPRYMDLL